MLYRRDWLIRVGGFDARYFCYFEDVDLNLRLQVAGGRCLFVPEARVHHVGGVSSDGRRDFVLYHSHRNLVWTFVKSAPPHIFWRYLLMHVLLNVASVVSFSAGYVTLANSVSVCRRSSLPEPDQRFPSLNSALPRDCRI